ncbi:MAG TPA: hypothetical protein VFQ12_00025 [Thermoleophilaceae bacterium]|nr:hypothetical protein [Thermoleophilaceae bacterium]
MSIARQITWGAAVRWLRWTPMIAGLIALDQVGGAEGFVVGLAIALDVAVLCLMVHTFLTKNVDLPLPEASWLEALFVWASISVLLTVQVTLTDPGGVTGRAVAVLCALFLGTLVTEMIAKAREPEQELEPRTAAG